MKIVIGLVGCMLALFCYSQSTSAEQWEELGENAVGMHYYDKSSIKTIKPGVMTVRTKIIYSQRVAKDIAAALPKATGLYLSINLDVLDCKNGQYFVSRVIHYDKHGKVLHDTGEDKKVYTPIGYRHIPEGTVIERLSEAVCKAGKAR
jgi:hypothetical protein